MSVLRYIIWTAIHTGVFSRKWTWVKSTVISIVILLILYINVFVLPFQWNITVAPYEEAQYDYLITPIFEPGEVLDDTLTPKTFREDLISELEALGGEVEETVYVYEYNVELVTVTVLEEIERYWLTEYANVVVWYDSFDVDNPLLISHAVKRLGVSIDGNKALIAGREFNIVGYFIGSSDIVVDHHSLKDMGLFQVDLGVDDILDSRYGFLASLYIKVDNISREELENILLDLIYRYSDTGRISIAGFQGREDIKRLIQSSVYERLDLLEASRRYYYEEYLNPVSPFTFFTLGSLIVYIAYIVKLVFEVGKDNLDISGLIYSIGGSDRHVFAFVLVIVILYTIPSILLSILVSVYWIYNIYQMYIPSYLILQWISPYVLAPPLIVLISAPIILRRYIISKGLSQVLSMEFG